MNKQILVAYFSRKGKNYVGAKIVDLAVGNTEAVAKMIKEMTGGDLVRIDTVTPYPADYTETTEVAQKELQENARPALSSHVEKINRYEVIFIGYPNWWGTIPMPVATFLSEYDLSGKIIIPFCTHEGILLGRSVKDIAKICPQSTILEGLAVRGADVKDARNEVSKWLRLLEMIE